MKFTREQKLEALKQLSPQERERITARGITDATLRVAERQGVQKEKYLAFSAVVGSVLLGLLPKEKLSEQLVAEVGLSSEKAHAVALEVEKEILKTSPQPPLKGGVQTPAVPPLREVSRAERGTEDVVSKLLPPHPAPSAGAPPLLRQGGDSGRVVSLRKEIPPSPLAPSASMPRASSLQTLLSDIRRGTAYDDRRISEAYRRTPREVRDALESVGFLSRLQEIARKFGLNVEETGEFVSESGLVMIGLTKPHEFVDHLTRRLRLPRDRALALGQAANMEIFRPVREILRKMNNNTNYEIRQSADTKVRMGEMGNTNTGLRFAPASSPPTPTSPQSPLKGGVQTPAVPPLREVSRAERGTEDVVSKVGGRNVYAGADPYREPIE